MGFTYTEAYNLPIWQRIWFLDRMMKEIKQSQDAGDGSTRATQHNSAGDRAMMGRHNPHAPARLRRFT